MFSKFVDIVHAFQEKVVKILAAGTNEVSDFVRLKVSARVQPIFFEQIKLSVA